jgi:dTDP-4-dehydrorhamnose reductase
MMRVLILGKRGMLGSMLYRFLESKGVEVSGTQRVHPAHPDYFHIDERSLGVGCLDSLVTGIQCIVNCIGVNRLDRASLADFRLGFYVNGIFPAYLQKTCFPRSIRVIHISTDAVFRSSAEPRYEDDVCDGSGDYALSKILGEVSAHNVLNIRCSIVGPEEGRSRSLLGWFLSQPDGGAVRGYTNHTWNGVTTLQLSEWIYQILAADLFDDIRKETGVIHYSPNQPLSKEEMLRIFRDTYGKDVRIVPERTETEVQRILKSRFRRFYPRPTADFRAAVSAMKSFSEYNPGGGMQ